MIGAKKEAYKKIYIPTKGATQFGHIVSGIGECHGPGSWNTGPISIKIDMPGQIGQMRLHLIKLEQASIAYAEGVVNLCDETVLAPVT